MSIEFYQDSMSTRGSKYPSSSRASSFFGVAERGIDGPSSPNLFERRNSGYAERLSQPLALSDRYPSRTHRIGSFDDGAPPCARDEAVGATISGLNRLLIKIPAHLDSDLIWSRGISGAEQRSPGASPESDRSDELDVATALLSMSTMQPLTLSNPATGRQTKRGPVSRSILDSAIPNKPQSLAPVINRMRKSCQCCTKSKLRCIGDGIGACERCTVQGTPCVYLHQRKRGPAPGSARQSQKTQKNIEQVALMVSTPSSSKRVNKQMELPSPAEKKRKASLTECSLEFPEDEQT